MFRPLNIFRIWLILAAGLLAGCSGLVVSGDPPDNGSQVIDSFEACLRAGYPVMESYPRQCRTADGQLFVEQVEATAEASTTVVEPEDPQHIGLAAYPDKPLATLPTGPISVKDLVEHRSALNGRTVWLRGVVVGTLLGEKACPPDRGLCAPPSIFLAETTDINRNPHYDVHILVSETEQEADYPIGEMIELPVKVQGNKTGLSLQRVETGVLEGHVTVGPLSPVVQAGVPEPTPAPEVYAERKIVIYAEDGQQEVTRVDIDGSGNYRVTLPVGVYGVDINHLGVDLAKGLPRRVEIKPQQTTRLDVNIDTGIR
ncbi:MAG: hypothetical protein AB1649_12125 [Chloroflexota bacterium]